MKLDSPQEPVLRPDYAQAFVCPLCGHAGPSVGLAKVDSGYIIRLQCPVCDFFIEYEVPDDSTGV